METCPLRVHIGRPEGRRLTVVCFACLFGISVEFMKKENQETDWRRKPKGEIRKHDFVDLPTLYSQKPPRRISVSRDEDHGLGSGFVESNKWRVQCRIAIFFSFCFSIFLNVFFFC